MLLANLGGADLIIVLVVVGVLVFGGKSIPKIAKNLGSAKSEFEKGLKESRRDDQTPSDDASGE